MRRLGAARSMVNWPWPGSASKKPATRSTVDTELVKPGLVPPECASSLRRLYQARLRSDYGDIAPASRPEADQAVTDAEEIVALLAALALRAKHGGL